LVPGSSGPGADEDEALPLRRRAIHRKCGNPTEFDRFFR
jgi:hypothetical protein